MADSVMLIRPTWAIQYDGDNAEQLMSMLNSQWMASIDNGVLTFSNGEEFGAVIPTQVGQYVLMSWDGGIIQVGTLEEVSTGYTAVQPAPAQPAQPTP